MKILLSIGIASSLALVTLSPLWAQTTIAAPSVLMAKQPPSSSKEQGLAETENMTEKNAGYYQLISNGIRALSRKEAVRSFTLAKSRVQKMGTSIPQSKKQELIQAAEDGLKDVDKINFAANREKYARYLEEGAYGFKRQGREDVARKFQRHADRVRSGEVTSLYDALR